MANFNGQLILSALQTFDGPATFGQIVHRIANSAGFPAPDVPHDFRESIQETLDGGVLYGFIKRTNRKYSLPHFQTDVAAVALMNKQPAGSQAVAGARKDGEEEMDNNQTNQLEEQRKREKGGKKKRAAPRR